MNRIWKSSFALVALSTLIFGCGRNAPLASTLMDTTSPSTQTDPNAPQTSVNVQGEGNLAHILDPAYWYSGGRPNVPECGPEKVERICETPSEEDIPFCRARSREVQQQNFSKGFHLVKVETHVFCSARCQPASPSCKGLVECSGDYLSYAAKKVLVWTEACTGACKRAVHQGFEFPYECRNINDDEEIQALKAEIEAKRKQLNATPEVRAKIAELNAVNAEIEKMKVEVALAKQAEAAYPTWMKAVHKPTMARIVGELTAIDDKILFLARKVSQEMGPVRDATRAAALAIKEGGLTKEALTSHVTRLSAVRGTACQTYDYDSLLKQSEPVFDRLDAALAEHNRKAAEIRNVHFIAIVKKHSAETRKQLALTDVPDSFRDGATPREFCQQFRRVLTVVTLLDVMNETNASKKDLTVLLASLQTAMQRIDAAGDSRAFQEAIRLQSRKLATALTLARVESRWNAGTRVAVEATKALYIVILPAIDLHTDVPDEMKAILRQEAIQIIEPVVKSWNVQAKALGMRAMVAARRAKLQRSLSTLAPLPALPVNETDIPAYDDWLSQQEHSAQRVDL